MNRYPNSCNGVLLMLAVALALPVAAQQAAPRAAAASAPDYSTVRYPSLRKFRCADGEYRGPEPGKRAWTQDTYTWAVTREFAQRFCMPESMVSSELKGAEAVAFRVKPSDEATCRLENGQEVCRRKAELQLELYLRADLNLPKSHPEVGFFARDVESSGGAIETNQSLKNGYRRFAGAYRDPAGKLPPYHAYDGPTEKRRVRFVYVDRGETGATSAAFYADFTDTYYQSNWVDGVDLVRLGPGPSLSAGMVEPPGLRRFGIGVIQARDMPGSTEAARKMTRDQYIHIVEVPASIAERIYAWGKQQDELFIGSMKRALGMPGAASAPPGLEPAIPPVSR